MPVRRVVLIIEEDRDTNEAITDLLTNEGYSCIGASDERRGLELIQQHRPDLVLLNVDLPGVGAAHFLVTKAANPAVAQIPVVVMTASTRLPKLANTVATLWKPFQWEELIDIVRKYAPP